MATLLVYGTAIVHCAYLVFVFFGGFLIGWRPSMLRIHLPAVTWALAVTITPLGCPLTAIEDAFRRWAGVAALDEKGFIVHYFEGKLYAEQYMHYVQVAIAAIVLLSWIDAYRRLHGGFLKRAIEPETLKRAIDPDSPVDLKASDK